MKQSGKGHFLLKFVKENQTQNRDFNILILFFPSIGNNFKEPAGLLKGKTTLFLELPYSTF